MNGQRLVFSMLAALSALAVTPSPELTITSSFPLGGSAGSKVNVVVRGANLQGAYQVLFDCPDLTGQVKRVEELKPEPEHTKETTTESKELQSVSLDVVISDRAQPGAHSLRVVSAKGVSGPLWFVVNSEAVTSESEGQHSTIRDA